MKREETVNQTFVEIRKNKPTLSESTLPKEISTNISTDKDLENTYNLALKFWSTNFNPEELNKRLSEYLSVNQPQIEDDEKLRKYFKSVRKSGIILGSATKFCHENPIISDKLIFFLNRMGKLNDNFSNEKGRKMAQEILNIIPELTSQNFEYHSTSFDKYQKRVLSSIQEANKYLQKEILSVAEFHLLRKSFRHLMNLFQLAAVQKAKNPQVLQTFHFVVNLNSALGNIHDGFVQEAIISKTNNRSTLMEIPSNLKIRLLEFYRKLGKSLK